MSSSKKKLIPRYSGRNSRAFWKLISHIEDKDDAPYVMCVMLQNIEETVLKFVNRKIEK